MKHGTYESSQLQANYIGKSLIFRKEHKNVVSSNFLPFLSYQTECEQKKKIRIQLTTISTITWLSFIGKSLFSTINQNNIKCKKKKKLYLYFLSNQTESVEKTLGGGGGLDKSLRGSRP